jgi:hypothetical protein
MIVAVRRYDGYIVKPTGYGLPLSGAPVELRIIRNGKAWVSNRLQSSRLQTPWCRCDGESELKIGSRFD